MANVLNDRLMIFRQPRRYLLIKGVFFFLHCLTQPVSLRVFPEKSLLILRIFEVMTDEIVVFFLWRMPTKKPKLFQNMEFGYYGADGDGK